MKIICLITSLSLSLPLLAQEESTSYVLQFPDGKIILLKAGSKTATIHEDSLKGSKFIITFSKGKSDAEIKGIGKGGNETYKAPLIKVGNDKNILTFLEIYDTASMMWTIWLSNSIDKKEPKIKRAVYTSHKSSLVGDRVQTFWGTAVNLDDALTTK